MIFLKFYFAWSKIIFKFLWKLKSNLNLSNLNESDTSEESIYTHTCFVYNISFIKDKHYKLSSCLIIIDLMAHTLILYRHFNQTTFIWREDINCLHFQYANQKGYVLSLRQPYLTSTVFNYSSKILALIIGHNIFFMR